MKKVLMLFVAASIFTACGINKQDPKAVTEAFVMAFSNQDWDGAKALATKESAEMIDGIKGMMAMAPKDDKKEPVKIKSIECKEDGDNCTCEVTYENAAAAEKMGTTYNLKKQDGNWLVDFKKDAGLDGMEGEDMDMDMDMEQYDEMEEPMTEEELAPM